MNRGRWPRRQIPALCCRQKNLANANALHTFGLCYHGFSKRSHELLTRIQKAMNVWRKNPDMSKIKTETFCQKVTVFQLPWFKVPKNGIWTPESKTETTSSCQPPQKKAQLRTVETRPEKEKELKKEEVKTEMKVKVQSLRKQLRLCTRQIDNYHGFIVKLYWYLTIMFIQFWILSHRATFSIGVWGYSP